MQRKFIKKALIYIHYYSRSGWDAGADLWWNRRYKSENGKQWYECNESTVQSSINFWSL